MFRKSSVSPCSAITHGLETLADVVNFRSVAFSLAMPTDDDTKPPANALSNGGVWTSGEPTGGETSVSDAMLASSAGGSVTRESSLLDEPARRRASSRRRRRRRRWVVGGVLAALVTAIGVSIVVYFVGRCGASGIGRRAASWREGGLLTWRKCCESYTNPANICTISTIRST